MPDDQQLDDPSVLPSAPPEPTPTKRPGRTRNPDTIPVVFEDQRISLRPEHWKQLGMLAEALGVLAETGKNYGKPSYRSLIRFIAENWIAIYVAVVLLDDTLQHDPDRLPDFPPNIPDHLKTQSLWDIYGRERHPRRKTIPSVKTHSS